MKLLKLKRFNKDETYVDMLKMILSRPLIEEGPQGPQAEKLDGDKVLMLYRISAKFDEVNMPEMGMGEIYLEDADYDVVADRVSKWRWGAATPEVAEFIQTVRDAESVSTNDMLTKKSDAA